LQPHLKGSREEIAEYLSCYFIIGVRGSRGRMQELANAVIEARLVYAAQLIRSHAGSDTILPPTAVT